MWQRLILLLCFTPLGACDCGSSAKSPLVVSDSFIELGSLGTTDELVENMHDYVPMARVVLDIKSRDLFVDINNVVVKVEDNGDSVLRAVTIEYEYMYREALRLRLITNAVGVATLGFYVDGEKIDERTIRVVEPVAIRLDVPVAVPTIPNPVLDPAGLYVGEQGADLLISFVTATGERAYGLGYAKMMSGSSMSIDYRVLGAGNVRPAWDVLVVPPLQDGLTSDIYDLDGAILSVDGAVSATVELRFVPEADIDSLAFVKRESLADFIQKNTAVELPQALLDALVQNEDPLWVCQDKTCVAKLEAKDADGHVVLGAPIRWDRDEDEVGDLLFYEPQLFQSLQVQARVNDLQKDATVKSDSFWVRSSTDAPESCDAGLHGSGAVALFALARSIRRRSRGTRRPKAS